MSNRGSDRVERILDLMAQGQMAEALSMVQETEASRMKGEAAELESCRELPNGGTAAREGRK